MSKEVFSYKEGREKCTFRTYQDQKCVHQGNKKYRQIGSCQEGSCPLVGKEEGSKTNSNSKP